MKERYLVIGRAGTGKTHLVLQKFLQYINQHKEDKAIFILPTQSQVVHLRDYILKASELNGYFDSSLVTFHGLSGRILDGFCLKKPIDENEKHMLLSSAFGSINTKY